MIGYLKIHSNWLWLIGYSCFCHSKRCEKGLVLILIESFLNTVWVEGCFGWDQASGYHKVCLRSVEKCVVDKNPLLLSRLSESGRNSTLSQKYSLGLAGRRHSTITLERKSTYIRHSDIGHMSVMMLTLCSPESLLVMLMSPTLSEASSVMSVGEEVSAPSLGDIICSKSQS